MIGTVPADPKPGEARSLRALASAAAAALLLVPPVALPIAAWAMASSDPGPEAPNRPTALAAGQPEPPPLLLQAIPPTEARGVNRTIAFAPGPNFPARPFRLDPLSPAYERALECLASAVYYEAATEALDGQRAVAQVILNRVRHPAFPDSLCGVVYQGSTRPTGCQFTFTCDGSLLRAPLRRLWLQARQVAANALSGHVHAPVGHATHYHADYVVPYWATSLAKNAQQGLHIFYRWPGGWGRPAAFRSAYARQEPDPWQLRSRALLARGLWPGEPGTPARGVVEAGTEPMVELAGILVLLADPAAGGGSDYARLVRSRFGPFADHPAVQLLRNARGLAPLPSAGIGDGPSLQLTLAGAELQKRLLETPKSGWDDPALLVAAARDFAARSGFRKFLAANRHRFEKAADRSETATARAATAWEQYSGLRVAERRLTLVFAPSDGASLCLAGRLGAERKALVAEAPAEGWTQADHFLRSGLSEGLFEGGRGTISDRLGEQLVRAAFARMTALSEGEAEGRRAIARETADGFELVPLLASRLKRFERSRSAYESLDAFLPLLLAGLPKQDDGRRGQTPRPLPSAAECEA